MSNVVSADFKYFSTSSVLDIGKTWPPTVRLQSTWKGIKSILYFNGVLNLCYFIVILTSATPLSFIFSNFNLHTFLEKSTAFST